MTHTRIVHADDAKVCAYCDHLHDHRPLLDRVFPPEQSDPGWGDAWLATLHPDRRMMA